jgi:hypothetical protein
MLLAAGQNVSGFKRFRSRAVFIDATLEQGARRGNVINILRKSGEIFVAVR